MKKPADQQDEKRPQSMVEQLKASSLKTAGYAYLVGDAALFASGMAAGRSGEAAAGLLWAAGGLVCAKYGNPDAQTQLKLLGERLGDSLRKQNIAIPDAPETKALAADGGVIHGIEKFLYQYPSQVLNAVYAVGALQMVQSGIQHRKGWDTATGALITAGALAGLLIPEKKPDPEHPATTLQGKAWEWIQEKPLRVSGALYSLNNVTLTMSALREMQANPKQTSYLYKFLTAGSYIFANSMLSLSSSSHAGGAKDSRATVEKLADASGRVIAAQAAPLRENLVEQVAGFLAAQPEVSMKATEISELLHRKLDSLQKSPTVTWQARTGLTPEAGHVPLL